MGDPVVGAGAGRRGADRGRVVGAVGSDRVVGGAQRRADLVGRFAVGALEEIEGDGAARGGHQTAEGCCVGDAFAGDRGGRGDGREVRGRFFDGRVLVVVEAGAVGGVVVGIA